MLYVSTRNRTDSFTSYRTLSEDCPKDGGFFAPFQLPIYTEDDLAALGRDGFSKAVAQILNLFFPCHITCWDIDFLVGRTPAKLIQIQHRLLIGEFWHNPNGSYDYLERNLWEKIQSERSVPTVWGRIAIRTAVLFGIFTQIFQTGIRQFDIAVGANDFLLATSAELCRKMGMPIEKIILGCEENSGIWDFVRNGSLGVATKIPDFFELFLYQRFGLNEVQRFLACRESNCGYQLEETKLESLKETTFAAVVGRNRIQSVAASIQRTAGYSFGAMTSQAYGAVQDYRAAVGENKYTLLLMDSATY